MVPLRLPGSQDVSITRKRVPHRPILWLLIAPRCSENQRLSNRAIQRPFLRPRALQLPSLCRRRAGPPLPPLRRSAAAAQVRLCRRGAVEAARWSCGEARQCPLLRVRPGRELASDRIDVVRRRQSLSSRRSMPAEQGAVAGRHGRGRARPARSPRRHAPVPAPPRP